MRLTLLFLLALQTAGRDMEKERGIWAQLEMVAPGVVDVFKEATTRMDSGNCKDAIPLYQKVVDAAPRFDPALRRLGSCFVNSGETERGLALLEKAVGISRSTENLLSLAQSLAYPGGKEGRREAQARALALAIEAGKQDPNPRWEDSVLVAQIALNLNHPEEFREAVRRLQAFPDLMVTHYFNAVRATMDERWSVAEDEIKRAGELGLDPQAVKEFLGSGVHTRATVWRYARYSGYMVAAWAIGLLALFVSGKALSNKTLRSIQQQTDFNASATPGELALRRTYRKLINVAGIYYYISLPVVILLVVVVVASLLYGFMVAGRIPVRLTVILVVGSLVTIYKMIQSLFIKVKEEDPGRILSVEEAPGLWTLAREVAADIGTRPIDEIRITPGTDLAVYERGTTREKSNDKAHRILILGTGVLNGFETNAFRGVLGHEYGHFVHRDTAGGDIAIRVNHDIMNFAIAMGNAGQAVWWNLAFQFLRLYHFLFRRISHGASRLQEVLADRMSAMKYGAHSFEAGLRHVVRRSIEFNYVANREIQQAVDSKRALQNLYNLQLENETSLEQEIREALSRQTSEDDTHPSPLDRFLLVRQVPHRGNPLESGMVWDLFVNREAVTNEMSALVGQSLR